MYKGRRERDPSGPLPESADEGSLPQLFTVLQELGSELVEISERGVLGDGYSSAQDLNELENSTNRVKHREVEQERRKPTKTR